VFPCLYHSTSAPHSYTSTCCSYQQDRGAKVGNHEQSSALADVGERWAGRYLNVISKLIKCNLFCPVRVQPISLYFFQFATDLPGIMFSNLISMYWSLSALDCSWKMPSACSSSWIERPSPPRQLGPFLSGGSSDTIWGPPNLPTYDQHLYRNITYYNIGTIGTHSHFVVISQHACQDIDPGVDGRIVLKWIFKKQIGGGGMNWIDLAQVAGSCECGNELFGSIKCKEFLDWLRRTLLHEFSVSGCTQTLTHCGRVMQICVFNTVKLGTSASFP